MKYEKYLWWEALGILPRAGSFGIEVEMEDVKWSARLMEGKVTIKNWKFVNDGSLRNGIEAVINDPVDDVRIPLEALFKEVEEVTFSERTSVHVHYNVGNSTVLNVINFYYTCMLIDAVFTKFGGESREGNLFCLRTIDTPGGITSALDLFNHMRKTNFSDRLKYSAVNLAPAFYQGSIEFRSLEGTKDVDKIVKFTDTIKAIDNWAKQFKSPVDIYNIAASNSGEDFLKLIGIEDMFFEGFNELFPRSISESISFPFEVMQ